MTCFRKTQGRREKQSRVIFSVKAFKMRGLKCQVRIRVCAR